MKKLMVAIVLLSSTTAFGQINVTLAPGATPAAAAIVSGLQSVTTISGDTNIQVTCSSGVDCNFVAVKVDNKTIPLSVDPVTRIGSIPLQLVSSSGSALHITTGVDGKDAAGGPFQLLRAAGTATNNNSNNNSTNSGGGTTTNNAAQQRVVPVQTICDRVRFEPSYSQSGNRAHFVVTPGGSIIQQPSEPIDENDVVVVHVVSEDEDMLETVELTRVSPTRTSGDLNLLGAGTFAAQSRGNACFERQFELGDFAPGEGKIQISSVSEGKPVVSNMTFTVNRLWDGILSLGPGWSHVVDQSFGTTTNAAGQNVVIQTENGRRDVVYVAHYTQYMWGRRDVEKTYPLHQHFNPSIGFALTNFKDHAFVGVSFDWKQFVFTGGVHAAQVTRLTGGTRVGDVIAGTTVPTEKKWQTGLYLAVTVDLRAAKALTSAVSQ
jgi:hypothetical protein